MIPEMRKLYVYQAQKKEQWYLIYNLVHFLLIKVVNSLVLAIQHVGFILSQYWLFIDMTLSH